MFSKRVKAYSRGKSNQQASMDIEYWVYRDLSEAFVLEKFLSFFNVFIQGFRNKSYLEANPHEGHGSLNYG